MVLKKSNSRLNSGATQRAVTHAGINKLFYFHLFPSYAPHILNVENYLIMTTDINMSNPEAKSSLRVCLEEMYKYLGFPMLDNSQMVTRRKRLNVLPNSAKYIGEYSLDKHSMWLLPKRIAHMKADTDFLKYLADNLDVRFHEVRDSRITKGSYREKTLRTKCIASSEIIAKSIGYVQQQPCQVTTRRSKTRHSRGVQRLQLSKTRQKQAPEIQHSEEDGEEDERGHLDVYLYAPCRMEARSANYRVYKKFAGCTNASRLKSSTKMNGRSKGKFPCRLGYCNRDLEVDTRDGIKEVYEENTDSAVFESNNDLNTSQGLRPPGIIYDITDFITVRRRRLKGENRDKGERATRNEEAVEDCAPLRNRVRHPKGSFVLVSKDECYWEQLNPKGTIPSFPGQHGSKISQNTSSLAHKTAQTVGLEVITTETPYTTREFELEDSNDFDRSFVLVSLAFFEEQDKWFHLPQEQRDTEVFVDRKYPVKLGASFPESFVIDCNPNKVYTSGEHLRVLIGRRCESGSDLWLVSLQDQWQTPLQTKQHLQKSIVNCKKRTFSIRELIDIARDLGIMEATTQARRTSKPIREEWMSSNFVWRNMPLNMVNVTESCTVEEAANILKEGLLAERNVLIKQVRVAETRGEDSDWTQCGVCLMNYDNSALSTSPIILFPCSHKYCVCCWRAHLQHCIRNTANSITCMSTNCTNVMDIATMSTILPYTLVHNWQAQVRNRRIDSSPYCRWCPNVACDKVVVSRSEMLKEQFGKVISCVCQQSWCGGCQGDPHWPASCDQMAAYRKLLAKTNSQLTFHKCDVTVQVEVKQCPACKYPIEKNEGCPIMLCILCMNSFCWNCLGNPHTHNACKEKNVRTTTRLLTNRLEIAGPLSWYPHCLMVKREAQTMQKIVPWLQRLQTKAACPLLLMLPVYGTGQDAKIAALHAQECVLFLKQAHALQEAMYVLIGFTELSERLGSKLYVKRARCKMCRLDFVKRRLSESVLKKPLSHLCQIYKTTMQMLQAGRNVMKELLALAPAIQNLSKDVITTSVGEVYPANLMRYK